MINLCEMKCTDNAFVIDKGYKDDLQKKMDVFIEEVHPKKAVHLTMITSNGIKHNEYSDIVQNEIAPETLFL